MTRRNSLKIAHPWLTFKYGEGHSYQNMTPSWSLFSCSVIYFVITSLRPLRLYHNYIGTRGMYRSGLHFFFYKTGSVFRTVSQISISSFHKSGINIISIFHLSLPPLSVLAPQHVILKNFQACISCPPPPTFMCCSSFLTVLTHVVFNFCYPVGYMFDRFIYHLYLW